MRIILAIFSFLFFLTVNAHADWSEDFAQLKGVRRSYEDSGAICEEVARLQVQKEYKAPQYHIEVGIAYSDNDGVVGELDVVVFDTTLNKVVRIGEVKCWRDLAAALNKAHDQRERFMDTVRRREAVRFFSTSTKQEFDPQVFDSVENFFSIAQKGSLKFGFDRELNYTLQEMQEHRYDMLRCQQQKLCVRP